MASAYRKYAEDTPFSRMMLALKTAINMKKNNSDSGVPAEVPYDPEFINSMEEAVWWPYQTKKDIAAAEDERIKFRDAVKNNFAEYLSMLKTYAR